MVLRKKDILYVVAIIGLILCVSACIWTVDKQLALFTAVILVLFATVLTHLVAFRKTKDALAALDTRRAADYRQIEAIFSLFATIQPRLALPKMRGWSISPDAANTIIGLIKENRPTFILEAGSGVSTLIAAYCCEKHGRGKIVSLDHEEEYAENTRKLIRQHGLESYASVIYAPLIQYDNEVVNQPWYDTSELSLTKRQIDLLIVDGPPQHTHSLARYPAVPLLYKHLSDEAVIVLDDYNRDDEKGIAKLWVEEFNDLEAEEMDTEHGTLVLRRKLRKDNVQSTIDRLGQVSKRPTGA